MLPILPQPSSLIASYLASLVAIVAPTKSGLQVELSAYRNGSEELSGMAGISSQSNRPTSMHGQAGIQLTSRLALVGQMSSLDLRTRDQNTSQVIAGATARVWLHPRLWVEAGAGGVRQTIARNSLFVGEENQVSITPAIMSGAGTRVFQGSIFAVDLSIRGAVGIFGDVEEVLQSTDPESRLQTQGQVYNLAINADFRVF